MKNKPMYTLVKNEVVPYFIKTEKIIELLSLCSTYEIPKLADNFSDFIYSKIYDESIETVLFFYENVRSLGILNGTTHNDRVIQFGELFVSEKYVLKLVKDFPVWYTLLNQSINAYSQYILDIIVQWHNEKEELNVNFHTDFGKIINISTSQGDLHGGKSVAIIDFENGKLVYKPRSAYIDKLFYQIIDKITENMNMSINFYSAKYLTFPNHSWHEFVPYCDCTNIEQIHRFYYRIGVCLALFYALSSIDMHYENLIAYGEYPIFVDLETIVRAKRGNLQPMELNRSLVESVLATSILPMQPDNRLTDVSFSAIFTGNEKSEIISGYEIVEDDIHDWRFERVVQSVNAKKNIPKLNGQTIAPETVEMDVRSGFELTLCTLIRNKDKIINMLDDIPKNAFTVRQLLRPTAVYARFIYQGRHPSNMRSIEEYENVFNVLINKFQKTSHGYLRVIKEVNDLKTCNIPIFTCKFDEKNLYSQESLVCNNYFFETPRTTVINKLEMLNKIHLNDQINLIKMSFLYIYGPGSRITGNSKELRKSKHRIDNILYVIKEYVNTITQDTFELSSDMSGLSMPILKGKSFSIVSMNTDIYNYGGLILFLSIYGKMFDTNATRLSNQMFNLFEKNSNDENSSVYIGTSSVLYLSANLYRINKDQHYADIYFEHANNVIKSLMDKDEIALDFLSGDSGLIYLICKLYNDMDIVTNITKQNITIIADKYCKHVHKEHNYEYGFAHGVAGIWLTLSELYFVTGNKECLDLINTLSHNSLESNVQSMGWCRGYSGELLSRFLVNEKIPELNFFKEEEITKLQSEYLTMNNMCLCHGKFGVIDTLITITKKADTSMFTKWFEHLSDIRFYSKTDYSHPSFMIGTSGIAYVLLRLVFPYLPSVLSLDLYKEMD